MTLKGPEFKKALLLGLLVAAIPLFYYPSLFGWEGAADGSGGIYLVEIAYYATAFYLFWSREKVTRILIAASTALGFRLGMGLVFATLLGGFHDVSWNQAFGVGLHGYLPGVVLHIAMVPYLLRPVFRLRELRRSRPVEVPDAEPRRERHTPVVPEPAAWSGSQGIVPDFDAAVAHVAAYPSVELALLGDHEGLAVARACRGGGDADLWAPLVNLLDGAIRRELQRAPADDLKRFTLDLGDQRVVVECVHPFYLTVLFDRGTDELVNVRIAQACDMVRRYYEHRYRKVAPTAATEVAYV